MSEDDHFPEEVAKALKYYVYRLIDPRNGETFYVGKGQGDRVFQHARGSTDIPDLKDEELDPKLQRIKAINASGFVVAHVIHRHGIDDLATALEVEAALIDAFPGLTNKIAGHGSDEFGVAHVSEIINRYRARQFQVSHKLLLISIGLSIADERRDTIYDATRYAWKINPSRADQADYILAHNRGLVVGVFRATRPWMSATPGNFPTLCKEEWPNRWGFEGIEASHDIQDQYIRKRIPDEFRKRGAANPIRFLFLSGD